MSRFTMLKALCIAMASFVAISSEETAHAQGPPTVIEVNPIIGATPNRVSHITRDPWTGQITIHQHQDQVHQSALDPNRNHVDPYSMRYVNEIRYDHRGRPYRVRGYKWTSYGRPHSQLTSTWITSGPGVQVQQGVTQHRNRGNYQQSVTQHRNRGNYQQSVTQHRNRGRNGR